MQQQQKLERVEMDCKRQGYDRRRPISSTRKEKILRIEAREGSPERENEARQKSAERDEQ